jgi:hypothetical protein
MSGPSPLPVLEGVVVTSVDPRNDERHPSACDPGCPLSRARGPVKSRETLGVDSR